MKSTAVTQMIEIHRIKPYEKNAKKHPESQIKKLAEIIQEFGFRQPILVDQDMVIVSGHGRLLAAKELNHLYVPVNIADDLTPQQIRAYRIADNKIAETDWDLELLETEIRELDSELLDYLGFEDAELEEILREKENNWGDKDPDEIPEVPQNVRGVERGQIWKLGDHRMMCGDSTSREDVERLMGGKKKADMVFTDPPYGVSFVGVKSTMYKKGKKQGKDSYVAIENDDARGEKLSNLFRDSISIAADVATSDAPFYIFFAINRAIESVPEIEKCGLKIRNWMIWDKGNVGYHAMGAQYKPNFESFVYCVRESPSWIGDANQQTIWRHSSERLGIHPTMKPVSLIEQAINNHECSRLYDCFLGSGSTLIACEKTNRECYGMEIDPHYCSVIIERWEKFTGKKAELKEPSPHVFADGSVQFDSGV